MLVKKSIFSLVIFRASLKAESSHFHPLKSISNVLFIWTKIQKSRRKYPPNCQKGICAVGLIKTRQSDCTASRFSTKLARETIRAELNCKLLSTFSRIKAEFCKIDWISILSKTSKRHTCTWKKRDYCHFSSLRGQSTFRPLRYSRSNSNTESNVL